MFEGSEAVEQPEHGSTENYQSTQTDSVPNVSNQPGLPDLEKFERFLFNGKEMTPKDLKSAYMAHSDYTKKSQALARERDEVKKTQEYVKNLGLDLRKVRQNPELAEEFRRVYPKEYHEYLEFAVAQTHAGQQREANPEIEALNSKLQSLEEFKNSYELKELDSQFENVFNNQIKPKYRFVDSDRMRDLTRAALESGYRVRDENGRIDGEVLEKLARYEHNKIEQMFQEYQKSIVDKQRAANVKARDIGAGGGIAGEAPKKLSFKEASQEYERMLTGSRQP